MHKLLQNIFALLLIFTCCSCNGTASPAINSSSIPTAGIQSTVKQTIPSTSRPTTIPDPFPATYTPAPTPTMDTRFELLASHGKKVVLWHPWPGVRGTALSQMVQEFNKSNPNGLQIELKAWGGMNVLLNALANSSEDKPDLVVLPPETIQAQSASPHPFMDIAPYISNSKNDIGSTILADVPNSLITPVKIDQQIYGLPAIVDTSVLIYNQTWAGELGFLAAPKTWNDLKDQVCAAARYNNTLKDRKIQGTGGWLVDYSLSTDLDWLFTLGGKVLFTAPDLGGFNNPEMVSTFSALKNLTANGCVWQGRNPSPDLYFNQRKALVISLPASKVQAFQISMQASNETDQWQVLSYPGNTASPGWVPDVDYFAILPSGNDQNLAAWEVVRWLISPEQEQRLALSDGSLPASKPVWASTQQAGTLPIPLSSWMESAGDPATPPFLQKWSYAQGIFQDGFYQIYQSDATIDQIPAILQSMDDTLSELEKHYTP
jgi:ABC-type glycerol-3-phosphate transport system substrate-binding protein